MADEALFHRDGETFTPTILTTGPWAADAMHGGPPAALVGHRVTAAMEPGEHLARVNVELERPVPLLPLTTTVVRRDVSRRVAHIDVEVTAAGKRVVSGRALVLTTAPMPEPAWRPEVAAEPLLGEDFRVAPPSWASGEDLTTYHQHAVEHRMPPGSAFGEPGAAVSWVRLRYPLVVGEETLPVCRVLAAADFGSGISSIYTAADRVGLINADLSVALERLPRGDWVRVDAQTTIDDSGSALCISRLADQGGPIGVGTQSLLGLTV